MSSAEQNIVATWRPEMAQFYKGIDAQQCAKEIESIGDSATPKQIVDKARSEDTELHKAFEWRDDVAAENWRCQQARTLCSNLIIYRPERKPEEPPTRYFYKASNGVGYQKAEYIYLNDDEHAALVARAQQELKAWKRRYSGIEELREIFDAIDEIIGS